MKRIALILSLISLFAVSAQAAPLSGTFFRNDFSVVNASQTAWQVIIASTVKAVKGITVSNSGNKAVLIAVGASGGEVAQMIVPASQAAAVFYPLPISQSQRISIQSVTSPITSGEFEVNLVYY